MARAEVILHAFGLRRGEARHGRLEGRSALVVLEKQEIVWRASLQREGPELRLLLIMSSGRPVELEVRVELGVEGARRDRLEGAADRLVLHFGGLALDLLGHILLLGERWS